MRNYYFKEKSVQYQIYDDFQKMVRKSKYEYIRKNKLKKNILFSMKGKRKKLLSIK